MSRVEIRIVSFNKPQPASEQSPFAIARFSTARGWSGVLLLGVLTLGGLFACVQSVPAADEFVAVASWAPPEITEVREHVEAWLDEQTLSDQAKQEISALWSVKESAEGRIDEVGMESSVAALTPDQILDRLATSIALAHPEADRLVTLFNQSTNRLEAENEKEAFRWLNDPQLAPIVANNLKLLHAGWLCRLGLYDECLSSVDKVNVDEVVDPAALLFYRAVSHQRLVQSDESRKNAIRLLERRDEIPRRYQQLATLIEADLKNLKVDSLDHIARRMDDIERRLEFGRAGKKVRDIEEGVIESLDKLIKEEEKKQQQQQQQQQQAQGNQPNSNQPMQDSQPAGGRGAGKVDKKRIGDRSGWGDLPPKQRDEALQQIGREYPAHYREIVEQYLKRLAAEGTTKNN